MTAVNACKQRRLLVLPALAIVDEQSIAPTGCQDSLQERYPPA